MNFGKRDIFSRSRDVTHSPVFPTPETRNARPCDRAFHIKTAETVRPWSYQAFTVLDRRPSKGLKVSVASAV